MRPLHAIRIAMEHPVESERISLFEGLEMFTVNAAKIGFLEDRKGMLKEGMDADFIVLSANPYAVKKEELSEIGVLATITGGNTVYGDLGQFALKSSGKSAARSAEKMKYKKQDGAILKMCIRDRH